MLWTWPTSRYGGMWSELDRLQREMNRLFEPLASRVRPGQGSFPAVNIWTGDDEALVTAEVPGVDPDKLDITVKNNTVTIRGERPAEELKDGESYLRQERGAGNFVRSFTLPFPVDSDKISAQYRKGILQLRLPRHEADKPRKISVNAG